MAKNKILKVRKKGTPYVSISDVADRHKVNYVTAFAWVRDGFYKGVVQDARGRWHVPESEMDKRPTVPSWYKKNAKKKGKKKK